MRVKQSASSGEMKRKEFRLRWLIAFTVVVVIAMRALN